MIKTRWNPVALDFVQVHGEPSTFRMQRLELGPPVQFDDESEMNAIITAVSRLVEADQTLDVQGGK